MSPPTAHTIAPTESYFVLFATGWVLTSVVARDLLPTQAAVTAAYGLGLAAMGAAAGAAWYRAPRWQAIGLGVLAAASGLLGPSEVTPADRRHPLIAWVFLGLYGVILLQAVAGWMARRGSRPGSTP